MLHARTLPTVTLTIVNIPAMMFINRVFQSISRFSLGTLVCMRRVLSPYHHHLILSSFILVAILLLPYIKFMGLPFFTVATFTHPHSTEHSFLFMAPRPRWQTKIKYTMEYNGALTHTRSNRQLPSMSVGRSKDVNITRASIYPLIFLVPTGLVSSIFRTSYLLVHSV